MLAPTASNAAAQPGAFPALTLLLAALLLFALLLEPACRSLGSGNGDRSSAADAHLHVAPPSPLHGAAATSLSLAEQLAAAKRRAAALRRQVGELSCRLNGIGPTGGFCLDLNHAQVGGNDLWSPALGDALAALFEAGSVLSLGAGLANYEARWEQTGLVGRGDGTGIESVRMYDGAENIELVTDGRVLFADLTEPLDDDVAPADWILSLEVGEHIAAGNATAAFVRNLHLHNTKGVVLSWGVPGQNGHFHVNNLPAESVLALFADQGAYEFDMPTSAELRHVASGGACCSWFRETIYVLRKTKQY
jgi:hypothetical protein